MKEEGIKTSKTNCSGKGREQTPQNGWVDGWTDGGRGGRKRVTKIFVFACVHEKVKILIIDIPRIRASVFI